MKTLSVIFFSDNRAGLRFMEPDFTWTETAKKIAIQIKNTGSKDVSSFTIYFDVEGEAVFNNLYPQLNHKIKGLKRGDSINLTADFTPLEHPNNGLQASVNKIIIFTECDKISNESVIPPIIKENRNIRVQIYEITKKSSKFIKAERSDMSEAKKTGEAINIKF